MLTQNGNLLDLLKSGGFAMIPLLVCSLLVWGIIFERAWVYWKMNRDLKIFYFEALYSLLRSDQVDALEKLCTRYANLPTSRLLQGSLERIHSRDERLREHWLESLERHRLRENQEIRSYLWVLGTIGSASPFIGLFGTVVGILRSFHEMAVKGSGGFAVVAGGISESLIATAAGIVVAVVAVLAYNALQISCNRLVLLVRLHTEEFAEMLTRK